MFNLKNLPKLGVGIGLRRAWFETLPLTTRRLDWLEFVPENYMSYGGRAAQILDVCRERWPLVAHGVNLNLGGTAPLDEVYLRHLKEILDRVDSPWFSDHLCWTAAPGVTLHELLPLPFSREAIHHVVDRIKRVRDYMGRPILVENISAYAFMPGGEMSEGQFLAEVLEQADCGLLLDVNNVWVNSQNHHVDPWQMLSQLPWERVVQLHMAGHDDTGDVIIDTHGEPIRREVWDLYQDVLTRIPGGASVLIERDKNIPSLDEVLDEADHARSVAEQVWGDLP